MDRGYLRDSLKKYYGDVIYFTTQECRNDVVCFSNLTAEIIREHHERMKVNTADEKDVKGLNFSKDEYPSPKEMTFHYEQPEPLELLLTCLFLHSSVRRNIVGQNVISSLRPRSSKMPFQLGMSMHIDHKFPIN